MFRMADRLPQDWEIDVEDLGNVYARARIQSCNGCVSTSMALCVWPCNCYERDNRDEPDLMWDLDLYARLDLADAWAFVAPVNWYAPTVEPQGDVRPARVHERAATRDEALIDHKNAEKARDLEHSPRWRELSVNHLEGRTAAFFCYGDGGGDEIDERGYPKALRHREWFDPSREPFDDERDAYAPLVWQCRYSGVEVPDALWTHVHVRAGAASTSDNQAEHLAGRRPTALAAFDACNRPALRRARGRPKGKVRGPRRWRVLPVTARRRAIRYADLMLKWRELQDGASALPPAGSSPARAAGRSGFKPRTRRYGRSAAKREPVARGLRR
jgi:hypothetical protein